MNFPSILLGFFLSVSVFSLNGQNSASPKLVVGVVVDQMKQEYLYRFTNLYSERGFNRLINNGFMAKNMHFNYIPTFTGPGHASIYTGTTPAIHGIIANYWYSREEGDTKYCVFDDAFHTIGNDGNAGKMSPRNMLSTTITDALQISNNERSKVIGLSIKDRGSILPAGHLADGAFWYDYGTGQFVSSSYYYETLPAWVEAFNNQKLPVAYCNQNWTLSFPVSQYYNSGPDVSEFENPGDQNAFPYNLSQIAEERAKEAGIPDFDLVKNRLVTQTPYGNNLLTEFAKAAINGEELGNGEVTDFLCVSYSSPDIIGHSYGPSSLEIADTYAKLDKDVEDLLDFLDSKFGEGEYVVFLTSDHGVVEIPNKLKSKNIPSGYFRELEAQTRLDAHLDQIYGDGDWILSLSNEQVFLNRPLLAENGIASQDAQNVVADYFLTFDGVTRTIPAHQLLMLNDNNPLIGRLQMGYHMKRSGDVLYTLDPAWIEDIDYGTTHGSGYSYDTHVPFLIMGQGVPKGKSTSRKYDIPDIAASLSMLLNIPLPNGTTGQPILEIFE